MRKLYPILAFLCLATTFLNGQTSVNIALLNDHEPRNKMEEGFQQSIKTEILQLLQHQYEVEFKEYYWTDKNQPINSLFEEAYRSNDIVIGLGASTSNYTTQLNSFPKPTVGSIVIDNKLQGLQKTDEGTSGINNFTYLESPFNIKRDVNVLHRIYPFEHLLVVSEKESIGDALFYEQLFSNILKKKNATISVKFYGDDIQKHLDELGDTKIAAYALPYLDRDANMIAQFFEILNTNKVPSAALFGESYIDAGALVGYKFEDNLQKIPRRIALKVMKIMEGQNAADLSVEMQTFGENLLLNMKTARQIEIYPDFDLMAQATLIKLEEIETDNRLTLQGAIAQAMKNNLSIKMEQLDVDISETEIGIAKSDLLPQIDATTSLTVYDDLTTQSYQGGQGRANWILSGQLSQIVFAEPILANLAIQKMLKESEEQQLVQEQLDVVLDISEAYMNILFAKSNLNIQQLNVARTKENYDISKAKEAIGYTGASDINRWEAELANANIDLNSAYATLKQAKFQLNQLLNRPINEPVEIEDISLEESMIMITDSRTEFINDYGKLEKFADFLVSYAQSHLPELAQIELGLQVQKRLQLSRERALYLPSVAVNASANRVLTKFNVPDIFPEKDNETTWNIGLGASYPIFQGLNRKKLVEQSKLEVLQLEATRKNTANQLELLIRANMETVGNSYSRMNLSRIAANASLKNYNIVRDAYSEGQSNITTLLDAQNNATITELTATNAVYSLILDFLSLERSIGNYNFLASTSQRDAFFQQALQAIE